MIFAKLDNLQLCDRSSYNKSFNLDLKIFIGIEEKSIGSEPEFAKISKILEAGKKNAKTSRPLNSHFSCHVSNFVMPAPRGRVAL